VSLTDVIEDSQFARQEKSFARAAGIS